MKESQRIALVGAGKEIRPFLARLPHLRLRLGPIKAPTLRVGSRLAHALRAGQAVVHWKELKEPATILIAVPDEILTEQVNELLEAELDLKGRLVVLCQSGQDSRVLDGFRRRGAAVAAVTAFPMGREWIYILDGSRTGVRRAAALLASDRVRTIVTRPDARALVHLGLELGLDCMAPLVAAARRSLRLAGVPRLQTDRLVEHLVFESLRRGNRSRLKMQTSGRLCGRVDVEQVRSADARLASLYERITGRAAIVPDRAEKAGAGG